MCPERVRNRVLNGRSGRLFASFALPGQARCSQCDVSAERIGKNAIHQVCSQPLPPDDQAEDSMPGIVNRWAQQRNC